MKHLNFLAFIFVLSSIAESRDIPRSRNVILRRKLHMIHNHEGAASSTKAPLVVPASPDQDVSTKQPSSTKEPKSSKKPGSTEPVFTAAVTSSSGFTEMHVAVGIMTTAVCLILL